LPAALDARQSARAATPVQINPTAPIEASSTVRRGDAITFLRVLVLKQERLSWRPAPRAEGINR
jgi:hypothetical protein